MGDIGISQGKCGVAGDTQGTRAAELAVEARIDRLIGRQDGARTEVDERPHPVGSAVAARKATHGLTIGIRRLIDGGRRRRRRAGAADDEALPFIDGQARRRADRRGGVIRNKDETHQIFGGRGDVDFPVHAIETRTRSGNLDQSTIGQAMAIARIWNRVEAGARDNDRDSAGDEGPRRTGAYGRIQGDGVGDGINREDVGAGREARASDWLTDDETGHGGERDIGAGARRGDAGDFDLGDRGEVGVDLQAGDGRAGVQASPGDELSDDEALDAVDLDDRRPDCRVADLADQAETVGQHAQVGGIIVGEDDRGEVADGEGTTARAAKFDVAGLNLDRPSEIVGLGARAERKGAVAGLGNALLPVD